MSERVRWLRVADRFSMLLPDVVHWDYQPGAIRSGAEIVDFVDALPGCPTCGAQAFMSMESAGIAWVRYDCDHEPVYDDDRS